MNVGVQHQPNPPAQDDHDQFEPASPVLSPLL